MPISFNSKLVSADANNAFVFKDTDDTIVGKINLENIDSANITDLQQTINDILDEIEDGAKKLENYVDDAAYVTENGAPTGGEIYFNTTDNEVRFYNGTLWLAVGSSPLTTKGDLLTNDGIEDVRFGVGTDGQILQANSAEPEGLEWVDFSSSPTTTEGDLIYRDATEDVRLPIGTNGQLLTSNGTIPSWQDAPVSTTLTNKGDIQGYDGATNVRVPSGSNGQLLTSNSSQSTGLEYLNLQQGLIENFIINNQFRYDLTFWTAYQDVDAYTIGTPTISLSRNISTPLSGIADLQVTLPNSDASGEGFSVSTTISNAYQAQVLTLTFLYDLSASDINDGDFEVVCYDTNNSVFINVVNPGIKAGKGKHISRIQFSPDSVDYEIFIRINTTASINNSVYFDAFYLSSLPVNTSDVENIQVTAEGNAGTVLTADVTPIDFITVTNKTGSWNGTQFTAPYTGPFTFSGLIFFGGTPTSGVRSWINGVIDKYVAENAGVASAVKLFNYTVELNKGDVLDFRSENNNTLTNNAALHYLRISYSQEQVSSFDFGTQDVIVESVGNNSAALVDGQRINFTEVTDTTGSWTGEQFQTNVSGWYSFDGMVNLTASLSRFFTLFINRGSGFVAERELSGVRTDTIHKISTNMVWLNKGDLVEIRLRNGSATLSNNSTGHYLTIKKEASSQQILGGAIIKAKYTSDSGQNITNSIAVLPYEDKEYDSHNAYNPITGQFIVPESDNYHIDAAYDLIDVVGTGESIIIFIYVNSITRAFHAVPGVGVLTNYGVMISADLELEKDDILEIRSFNQAGLAPLAALSYRNYFNIRNK